MNLEGFENKAEPFSEAKTALIQAIEEAMSSADINSEYLLYSELALYLTGKEIDSHDNKIKNRTSAEIISLLRHGELKVRTEGTGESQSSIIECPWLVYYREQGFKGAMFNYAGKGEISVHHDSGGIGSVDMLDRKKVISGKYLTEVEVEAAAVSLMESLLKQQSYDAETFSSMDDNCKRLVFDASVYGKCIGNLNTRHIALSADMKEQEGICHILRSLLSYGKSSLVAEVIPTLPPEEGRRVARLRKMSVDDALKSSMEKLVNLDKERFNLHRKIEGIRFYYERGLSRAGVALDIVLASGLPQNGVEVTDTIRGIWREGDKDLGEDRFEFHLGITESTYNSSYNDSVSARIPGYESAVKKGRTRDEDAALAKDCISAILIRYPQLDVNEDVAVRGSFHEVWAGETLYISKESLIRQAESEKVEVKDLLKAIADILKKKITSD